MPSIFSKPAKITRFNGLAFGITAKKYCPNHGTDIFSICNTCFADNRGFYKMGNVKNVYEWRGELTKRDDFATIINWELEKLKKRPKYFRIHDSGDFYSDNYLYKWLDIVAANPDIEFYCYTKEISRMLKILGPIPNNNIYYKNLTVCFSYGGKQDDMINPYTHLHSYVFHDKDTLDRCGFVDASYDDLMMIKTSSLAIGLVEH